MHKCRGCAGIQKIFALVCCCNRVYWGKQNLGLKVYEHFFFITVSACLSTSLPTLGILYTFNTCSSGLGILLCPVARCPPQWVVWYEGWGHLAGDIWEAESPGAGAQESCQGGWGAQR